jgi:hypothetical protein
MLTFEFPSAAKADYFVARLQRERHDYVKSPSGKVVDVMIHPSEGPSVNAIIRDYLTMLAAHFGAYDVAREERVRDRLYTLHTWGPNERPRDHEVTITTLDAFLEANPNLAEGVVQTIQRDGEFTGGGGSQPCWRLKRTPFVGREI